MAICLPVITNASAAPWIRDGHRGLSSCPSRDAEALAIRNRADLLAQGLTPFQWAGGGSLHGPGVTAGPRYASGLLGCWGDSRMRALPGFARASARITMPLPGRARALLDLEV